MLQNPQLHYLDNAATTIVAPEVADVIDKAMREHWANPSSLYGPGARSEEALNAARAAVARTLGCKSRELYFTSCGSESNNLALLGAVQTRTFGKGIVVSGFEHPSVQRPLERLAKQGYDVTVVAPRADGTLDIDAMLERVDKNTILVACMMVNNEIGTRNDVERLAALSRAVVCEKDFDTICQTAEDYLGSALHGIRTFKVEARRADKTYPMTSPELMRELGAYLLGKHSYLKVDVHNPQFKVIVEIRDYGAYIHGPKIPGEGGLPVGTSGRALNMLSGGIDSPVAAYRMAKRGLALDHIHFASPPYTSERAKLKVKALAQLITVYTGSANLFVVPYTKPQEYIRDNAPDVLFTVLMRRSMMRIANVIAKKQGCEALVTGESLAQVASQTVKALQCTDAAQDLPILRPLIGMDKTEIIETSRHINTFETSILPYEDCCTIFTPPHPKIRPELAEILEAEAAMPGLAELEAEAAENTERIRIRITDEIEFEG